MFDDPTALTSANWQDIHNWLTFFWIYFPLIITAAFCALTAHAFIPSLISTGHLPQSAGRFRKPLTIFGLLVLVVAAVLFVMVVKLTIRVENVWNRFLI
ncbi:MAG: hypothetical protein EXR54_03405 [Dehalococcoidia bacterium]|nr:hypothetical protein [Dehalococcoidia bacterium]MSQ16601.1 hypothetical protein [Dehalococcoidia bacterium]